jgi:hypothetical protein
VLAEEAGVDVEPDEGRAEEQLGPKKSSVMEVGPDLVLVIAAMDAAAVRRGRPSACAVPGAAQRGSSGRGRRLGGRWARRPRNAQLIGEVWAP